MFAIILPIEEALEGIHGHSSGNVISGKHYVGLIGIFMTLCGVSKGVKFSCDPHNSVVKTSARVSESVDGLACNFLEDSLGIGELSVNLILCQVASME